MWCRLITGARADQAQSVLWPQAGTASGPAAEAPRTLYVDPGPPAAPDTGAAAALREAEAYRRGVQEGEVAATQRMAEQLRIKVEQLGRSIEQLALHRAKIQREAEPELVRLSLAVARRIMRRELSVDPESLMGLLKVGLEKIESADTHRVRVHPEHAPALTTLLAGAARPIQVVADAGLPVGAVVFETTRGAMDVGMETQLKEIERGFADLYPQ